MRKLWPLAVIAVLAGCGVSAPPEPTTVVTQEPVVLSPFEQDLEDMNVPVNEDTNDLGRYICKWFDAGNSADHIMTTSLENDIDPYLLGVVAESATANLCPEYHDEMIAWAVDNA